MSITTFLMRTIAVFACITSQTANAEVGRGIIEDPITREYTRGVYKDWQEGIVLHPETGNYVLTYKNDAGSFSQIIFEPATNITPTLISKFKLADRGQTIQYRYTLRNARTSKQGIDGVKVVVSSVAPGHPVDPMNWQGAVVPTFTDSNFFLSWICFNKEEVCSLSPGAQQSGFAVESNDLPGIRIAEIRGSARPATWLGLPDISTPIGKQIEELTSAKDFVSRPAAVPRIPVPTPFNAAAVLAGIQKHMNEDWVKMKLIDPGFAASLDRLFQTAVAAAQHGNTTALRSHLKEIRHALKKEHVDVDKEGDDSDDKEDKKGDQHLIEKLAAKVLDFDLKYVLKRLGHKE